MPFQTGQPVEHFAALSAEVLGLLLIGVDDHVPLQVVLQNEGSVSCFALVLLDAQVDPLMDKQARPGRYALAAVLAGVVLQSLVSPHVVVQVGGRSQCFATEVAAVRLSDKRFSVPVCPFFVTPTVTQASKGLAA